ncbi:MAG TPA: hypothetical protein DCY74_00715 [Clostridiales bacterium]|jgi:uncharacterized protein|nr:hypothetical protein [Clostridiales bacterium]HBE12668.1 hypothetical protein [Clostridiales bacterium]HCG36454.1 hypothetical protein [Clostridiales bacterium]
MNPRYGKSQNPALLDVSALMAGEMRTMPFERQFVMHLKEDEYALREPAVMAGTLTNMAGYITFEATLTVKYTAVCCRCLDETVQTFTLDLDYPVADQLENSDTEEYLIPVAGKIDLEELARLHFMLHLPYRHLCREDCKGLCPRCGHNLNREACSCQPEL